MSPRPSGPNAPPSPPTSPNPFSILFGMAALLAVLLWVLRGFRLLGFLPGLALWAAIGLAIAAGIAWGIWGRKRRW